jgi:predicted ATP-grasp superfamily ATP-dependent carboligase
MMVPHLREIVRTLGIDLVFAGDDEHLLVLSENREQLSDVTFPYPDHDVVLKALDKLTLYEAARQSGLSVPETRATPPSPLDSNWVVKSQIYRPGTEHEHRAGHDFTLHREQQPIFQRTVNGYLLAVVTLTAPDSQCLYIGAQRAEAIYPEPFGVSVRARMVALDHGLATQVQALIRQLGWWGLAELQFIVSPDGEAHLIDLNGRFFGSLALTTAAAGDLPSAWVMTTYGQTHEPLAPRRSATRYQWLEGDLRRISARNQRSAVEYWRTLRYAVGAVHSLWDASDPAPACFHSSRLMARALRKVVRS